MSASDFIDGQRDCREGKPLDESRSADYKRGYEYEEWRQEWKLSELGKLI